MARCRSSLGRGVARHHRLVLALWLVVLVASGYVGGIYKKSVSDNFRIPHSDSQAAYDLLGDRFGSQNAATATVVFSAEDGAVLTSGAAATAVGTAVVDLYALTNPQHTPWRVPHRILFHDVPCRCCYKSTCPEGHHDCLRRVAPKAVAEAALSLLPGGWGDGRGWR